MTELVRAVAWRKSSRCGTSTCVEVARVGDTYLLRDSKDPENVISLSAPEYHGFIENVAAGEYLQ